MEFDKLVKELNDLLGYFGDDLRLSDYYIDVNDSRTQDFGKACFMVMEYEFTEKASKKKKFKRFVKLVEEVARQRGMKKANTGVENLVGFYVPIIHRHG